MIFAPGRRNPSYATVYAIPTGWNLLKISIYFALAEFYLLASSSICLWNIEQLSLTSPKQNVYRHFTKWHVNILAKGVIDSRDSFKLCTVIWSNVCQFDQGLLQVHHPCCEVEHIHTPCSKGRSKALHIGSGWPTAHFKNLQTKNDDFSRRM